MEEQIQNKRKILLMIGIGMIVIFILFIIIFLVFHKKPTHVQNNVSNSSQEIPTSSTTNSTSRSGSENVLPTITPPQMSSYQDQEYHFSYPSTWQPKKLPVVNGGTLTGFAPQGSGTTELFPRIDIQVVPISQTYTISTVTTNLSKPPLNFTPRATTFQGENAVELGGVLPFVFPNNEKVYKEFILLNHNGQFYIIDYAYVENRTAAATKQEIMQSINTLQL